MLWFLLFLLLPRWTAAQHAVDAASFLSDMLDPHFSLFRSTAVEEPRDEPTSSLLVIGVGLPRTATLSLCSALQTMGTYKCFHTKDFYRRPAEEALDALLQAILSLGYNATSDYALGLLAPRLAARYPNARYILTVRDSHSVWRKSFSNTLDALVNLNLFPWNRLVSVEAFNEAMTLVYNFHAKYSPCSPDNNVLHYLPWLDCLQKPPALSVDPDRLFDMHSERIHAAIPRDRLLVFNARQGWGPLAAFLQWPVPKAQFPFLNTSATTVSLGIWLSFVSVAYPLMVVLWTFLMAVLAWYAAGGERRFGIATN